ncbi:MAG TPA: type II secretion system protein [Gaiellaceae bacterium]
MLRRLRRFAGGTSRFPQTPSTGSLRERAADAAGYSVVELLTVMSILSVILGGLVSVFVAGSNADADLNRRYQAQTDARIAMDKLRREVHRACDVGSGWSSTQITFYFLGGAGCIADSQSVSWCVTGSGSRFALYRIQAASCTGATARYADYLISSSVFAVVAGSDTNHALSRLHVDLNINRTPTKTVNAYHLADDIAFRNFTRL